MTTRNPFDEMNRAMANVMDQMEQFRRSMQGGDTDSRWSPVLPSVSWGSDARIHSNLSVETDESGYVVYADVPGFERNEFDITFDGGVLTISATHAVEDEHSSRSRTIHERVTIPGDVIVEECSATYRNGVLEVVLPTAADPDDAHRIDVE